MSKLIQKRRTEQEMRTALQNCCDRIPEMSTPPQIDDSDVILNDVIEELLEKRQILEDIKGFAQTWAAKLVGR